MRVLRVRGSNVAATGAGSGVASTVLDPDLPRIRFAKLERREEVPALREAGGGESVMSMMEEESGAGR